MEHTTRVKEHQVQVVDRQTGQELNLLIAPRRTPHPYNTWLAVDQTTLFSIACNRDLSPCALRVLLLLKSVAQNGNYVNVTQADCANQLGFSRQQVNTAWKQLKAAKLVESVGQINGRPVWAISPDLAWRGSKRELSQALTERKIKSLDDTSFEKE